MDKNKYQCTICDRVFTSQNGLKYHSESVHEGKKPFQCLTCEVRFTTQSKG